MEKKNIKMVENINKKKYTLQTIFVDSNVILYRSIVINIIPNNKEIP
ncbi:MAG: hypothetical protein KGD57_08445 [Candidatus Lokiarchaeota archaeon]|nr:hypothetical protein [Candidatus Lokiarchaeota archaeon]